MNPKPRERLEMGSFITAASCTAPYCLKYLRSLSIGWYDGWMTTSSEQWIMKDIYVQTDQVESESTFISRIAQSTDEYFPVRIQLQYNSKWDRE